MSEITTAPAPAPAAPALAPAAPAPDPVAPAPAPASALAAGAPAASAPPAAPAPAPQEPPSIPEKFLVKGADGAIDHEATARKVAEGYTGLEKRLGSGDAPPATVDGYKVNVPEALKDKISSDDLAKDEGFKGFMAKLHAAGASQKVVDAAVSEMLVRGTALREAMPALDAAECEATLRQADGWKSDGEYKTQIGLAFTAGQSIFGKDFDGILKDYGNDARIVRGLASIGKEMQEDRGPSPEAQAEISSNLDQLQASPAYLNANDPKHAETVAKVDALTKQLVGTKSIGAGKTISFKSA